MQEDLLESDHEHRVGNVHYKLTRHGVASRKAGRDIYTASVLIKETYGIEEVAKRMVANRCAVKESTIRLVLQDFADLVGELTAEGRAVNIGGVVRFMPTICGTFDSPDAPWDPKKHAVMVRACSGKTMRRAAAKSPVTRVKTEKKKAKRTP